MLYLAVSQPGVERSDDETQAEESECKKRSLEGRGEVRNTLNMERKDEAVSKVDRMRVLEICSAGSLAADATTETNSKGLAALFWCGQSFNLRPFFSPSLGCNQRPSSAQSLLLALSRAVDWIY